MSQWHDSELPPFVLTFLHPTNRFLPLGKVRLHKDRLIGSVTPVSSFRPGA